MLGGDEVHVVLLRPGHAALEDYGQEDAGDAEDGLEGVVGELDLVVCAVGGVADGLQRGLADLQELGPHPALAVEPEILGIPVAVVHGQGRKVLRGDAVDDRVRVLFLHPDLIDPEDEVCAEFARDAVEVVVGRLVAAEFAGSVPVRAVELPHPGAFDDLDRVGQDLGPLFAGLLLQKALLQAESALRHLVGGLVAGPGELHGLPEGFRFVVDEVDRAAAAAQDVLGGVGRIAAAQEHGVVVPARHVVGLHQGIGAEIRRPVLAEGGDDDSRHREEKRGLVEIVNDTQVFKAAHPGISSLPGFRKTLGLFSCLIIISDSSRKGKGCVQSSGSCPPWSSCFFFSYSSRSNQKRATVRSKTPG